MFLTLLINFLMLLLFMLTVNFFCAHRNSNIQRYKEEKKEMLVEIILKVSNSCSFCCFLFVNMNVGVSKKIVVDIIDTSIRLMKIVV